MRLLPSIALLSIGLLTASPGAAPPPDQAAAADLDVAVREAESGVFTLTTATGTVDEALFVSAGAHFGAARAITIAVTPLRAAGGRLATLTIAPAQLPLAPSQIAPIAIRGMLDEVGSYKGVLTISDGKTRHEWVMVAKRERGESHVTVEAIPDPPLIRWWPLGLTAQSSINVTESAGASATFTPPVLQKLVRGDDPHHPGAKYESWSLTTSTNAASATAAAAPGASITLAPNDLAKFTLTIAGLQGTGQYDGTVRVTTPSKVETQTFTLFVKDPWLLAALVILAGVWSSFWLRRWLQVGRLQAVNEINIRRTFDRIVDRLADAADPIRKAVEARLIDLRDQLLVQPDLAVEPGLQNVTAAVTNYLAIRSTLAVRDMLPRLVPDDDARRGLERRFTALEEGLQQGGLQALENDAQQHNALAIEASAIRASLAEEVTKTIKDGVTALRAAIKAERDALPQAEIMPADVGPITAILDRALQHLDIADARLAEATTTAAAGLAALERGRMAFDAARRAFVDEQVTRFRSELTARTEPPLGLIDQWDALRRELLTSLETASTGATGAAGAVGTANLEAAYRSTRRQYLQRLLAALETTARGAAQQAHDLEKLDAATAFGEIVKKSGELQIRLAAGLDVSVADYAALRAGYDKAMALVTPAAGASAMGLESIQLETAAVTRLQIQSMGLDDAAGVGEVPPLPAPAESLRPVPSLVAEILRNDSRVAWIVTLASVLVGLRLLWVANNTFGALSDYIGAFLWGFGLHELNRLAAPEGLAKLGLALPAIAPSPAGASGASGAAGPTS